MLRLWMKSTDLWNETSQELFYYVLLLLLLLHFCHEMLWCSHWLKWKHFLHNFCLVPLEFKQYRKFGWSTFNFSFGASESEGLIKFQGKLKPQSVCSWLPGYASSDCAKGVPNMIWKLILHVFYIIHWAVGSEARLRKRNLECIIDCLQNIKRFYRKWSNWRPLSNCKRLLSNKHCLNDVSFVLDAPL